MAFSLFSPHMPPQASTIAPKVDLLYDFMLISSFIGGALLIFAMLYFIYKYKRKTDNDKTAYITHNAFLEFLWSFIPLVIFLIIFVWGAVVYYEQRNAPANAFEVGVTGSQWAWTFEYRTGKQTAGELFVPINTPIKLLMNSKDVIHSFYVPSFRVKQDVVPGMYTSLWFEANEKGTYQVFCTEFCGLSHSAMLAKIHVLDKNEFDEWLKADEGSLSPAKRGEKLFALKTCNTCHSVDGKKIVGPTFKGLFGSNEELEGGGSVKVDENYIRESILAPNAKIVKGYPAGQMPPFQGQVSDEEVAAIIEFLKTLK